MLNFLKNLFGSRLSSNSQVNLAHQETLEVGGDQVTTNVSEYTGPKKFANKPAVDYLLKHAKYQDLPELAGRAIHFQSLFTIEDDIQKALSAEYPFIGKMLVDQRQKAAWYGSPVCPKYILFCGQLMQVDFLTSAAECKALSLDDLDYLRYLQRDTDSWLHDEKYCLEVFTLDDLGYQLDTTSGSVYLHMIIDSGRPWCSPPDPVREKLGPDLTARMHAATNSGSEQPLYESIVDVYNEKFFPAQLIIREACLTNFMHDRQSCVYSHRYFYF